MASLQTIEEEMRVAGAAVWPMSGLDDVARLFLAAANFARGAFDIAERVAARFADKLLEVAPLRSLLKQMTPSSMPHVSQLLGQPHGHPDHEGGDLGPIGR